MKNFLLIYGRFFCDIFPKIFGFFMHLEKYPKRMLRRLFQPLLQRIRPNAATWISPNQQGNIMPCESMILRAVMLCYATLHPSTVGRRYVIAAYPERYLQLLWWALYGLILVIIWFHPRPVHCLKTFFGQFMVCNRSVFGF